MGAHGWARRRGAGHSTTLDMSERLTRVRLHFPVSGSRSRIGVDGRAFPFAVKRVESAPRLRHRWTRGQRAVPCRLVGVRVREN